MNPKLILISIVLILIALFLLSKITNKKNKQKIFFEREYADFYLKYSNSKSSSIDRKKLKELIDNLKKFFPSKSVDDMIKKDFNITL